MIKLHNALLVVMFISIANMSQAAEVYWSAWSGGDSTGWATPWNWGREASPSANDIAYIIPGNPAQSPYPQPEIRVGMSAVADQVQIWRWSMLHPGNNIGLATRIRRVQKGGAAI